MHRTAHKYYTKLFGQTRLLTILLNQFSDSSIEIEDPVDIGRQTSLLGNINISQNVSISSNVHIRGDVDIGEYSNLNGNNSVIGDVCIGKYCAIAPRARIRSLDHPTYKPGIQMGFYRDIGAESSTISKGPVEVGNDVWICSDAKILPDVKIGNGAVIAANSVVVDDVDPYSIVAGNPAEHKRYRFSQETIDSLIDISWWDWDRDKQKRNTEFFSTDLREVEDIKSLIK